jgi:hypothetical protein
MEDVVENIRDHLEAHPRTYLTRLSLQTVVGTCHKIVKEELVLTSIQSNNCTIAPP